MPTPNTHRTASGAPGKDYWQQRADYDIRVTLDENNQILRGEEVITYHNNSPDTLPYLWVQLDQNIRKKDSDTPRMSTSGFPEGSVSTKALQKIANREVLNGGFSIDYVKNDKGKQLPYTINKTMMRVDLPDALSPGSKMEMRIAWWYRINDRSVDGGRSGHEYFPADGNYLYAIAQFYPRMAVYNNEEGWQNKQFIGNGEFTLSFGTFRLSITAPADHVVAATGTLENPNEVLSKEQVKRWQRAQETFDRPVFIITEEEATENERSKSQDTKTWRFRATDVRDVAFASSRKFIWDAMAVPIGDKTPMAVSVYPKEGNPLWALESTRAVANTLKTYSKYTIPYPYPVAISVHTASIGMEYPMICFNWGRPDKEGKYTDRVKWRMIGVIIHEVGHNFFPMIVNSDERQWTWMDEGLNSFVETLTERENYADYPLRRGFPDSVVDYMRGDKRHIRPIMTNSEQIVQFGNNAYSKPAAALSILQNTVMGKALFDHAFKEYARRWAFKHPTPADFFRTMEDASGVDLDWFWRGWFYSVDHVDIGIEEVTWYRMDAKGQAAPEIPAMNVGKKMSNALQRPLPIEVTDTKYSSYWEFMTKFRDEDIREKHKDLNFYQVKFKNEGGLVMPIIVQWTYEDGSTEKEMLPAEIWRYDEREVKKVFAKDKKVVSLVLDPDRELADTETTNDFYPKREVPSKLEEFKKRN